MLGIFLNFLPQLIGFQGFYGHYGWCLENIAFPAFFFKRRHVMRATKWSIGQNFESFMIHEDLLGYYTIDLESHWLNLGSNLGIQKKNMFRVFSRDICFVFQGFVSLEWQRPRVSPSQKVAALLSIMQKRADVSKHTFHLSLVSV